MTMIAAATREAHWPATLECLRVSLEVADQKSPARRSAPRHSELLVDGLAQRDAGTARLKDRVDRRGMLW